MKKQYLKYLGILAVIVFLLTAGIGMYNQHTYNVHIKGLKAIQLVIDTEPEVITGLILTKRPAYIKLRDMLIAFEPLNEQEHLLHQEALKKILKCLEDAQAVLEGKLDPNDLINDKKKESISI